MTRATASHNKWQRRSREAWGEVLTRFADAHRVPLLKNDDFGHGERNAILPIGRRARMDADAGTLAFGF